MPLTFAEQMKTVNSDYLKFRQLETIQVNLGNLCNLHCTHCHVEAGPDGDKIMARDVMETVVQFLESHPDLTLDVTGGCPEMNPNFKWLVRIARPLVSRLMVRTNFVIQTEPDYKWLPEFFKQHEVVLIGSMPCYFEENVNKMRGAQTYQKTIQAIRYLNQLEYGKTLELNLVYNPGGEFLPPDQKILEKEYKSRLKEVHDIEFNSLFTLANAPIGRYKQCLNEKQHLHNYYHLLMENFNPDAAEAIMCRSLISINYLGQLFPCDFHLAEGIPIRHSSGRISTVNDLTRTIEPGRSIQDAAHCFVCTAGAGSSCTGALDV